MEIRDKTARNTSFSRSLMAGLICGMIAAMANAAYNFYYRKATGFENSKIIEPLIIFIAFPLLLIVADIIFFEMVEYIKRGRLLFTILFLVAMLTAIIVDLFTQGTQQMMSGTRGLLFGMGLITGLLIAFLLPFLATHPKIFMENEELSESS